MVNVEEYLQSHNIEYTQYEHPAVFTVEEAEEHCGHIPGMHCKNLFFRNKKKTRWILLVMPAKKPLDIKSFG